MAYRPGDKHGGGARFLLGELRVLLRANQVEAEPQRHDGAQGDRYGDQAAIMGQIGPIERRMFADAIHHGLHKFPFRVPLVLPPEIVFQAENMSNHANGVAL